MRQGEGRGAHAHVEPAERGVVVLGPRLERPAGSRRRRQARAPCALLEVGRSAAEQRCDQLLVVEQRGPDVRRVAAGHGRDGGPVHGRGGGAAARRSPARAGVVRTDAGQRRHAHLACGEGRRRPGRRCTRRPGPWRGTGPWRGSGRRGPARCELAGRSLRSAQCWWLSRGLHAFTAQCRSHAIGVHGLAPYRAAHRSAGWSLWRHAELWSLYWRHAELWSLSRGDCPLVDMRELARGGDSGRRWSRPTTSSDYLNNHLV